MLNSEQWYFISCPLPIFFKEKSAKSILLLQLCYPHINLFYYRHLYMFHNYLSVHKLIDSSMRFKVLSLFLQLNLSAIGFR